VNKQPENNHERPAHQRPRLWDLPDGTGQIGATDKGGVKRLALTDLDRQGRDLVVRLGQGEAGLSVTVDKIGNVFMRREGRNPACRRSSPAATSTPSRPAASSTATTACWPGSKWCAP
jgi:hypothetical protein